MIFFRKPNGAQIKEALDQQAKLSFSYAETEVHARRAAAGLQR